MMHDALVKNKQLAFDSLAAEAQACQKCENLCERVAVLSQHNGKTDARILFIGEAPGRNGGDRTRMPFTGDASGANFQKFIDSINLKREQIFITNTVLCNPRTPTGANRKPSKTETNNCADFLRRQIELLEPQIVATLGSVALEALKQIAPHDLSLRANAGQIYEWNARLLVPLYHPSPQVLASHRRAKQQLFDYRALAEAIRKQLTVNI
jgi:uracil-DNA glycosylase